MSEKHDSAAAPGLGIIDQAAASRDLGQAAVRLDPVRYFCAAFAKAVRSYNLYARNNAALDGFLSAAHRYIDQAMAEIGDLDLNIRRDRLTMEGEDVLVDADRESGIPFRLFREGIRRVTLELGMDRAELDALIEILARPPARASLDDDMVCMLWRADLPHFRYLTLDIYDAGSAEPQSEDHEQHEEIRQDLDKLLASIYAGGSAEDGIKAINIGADDLVALATLGEDRERDTERIGQTSSRAIFNLPEEQVALLRSEVADESERTLLDTTFEVLLGVLFRIRSSIDSQQVLKELVGLYDGLLLERDFYSAARLVRQMIGYAESTDLKNVAIVKQLFRVFSSSQRMQQVATHLNDGVITSTSQLRELLQALGTDVVPSLLAVLPAVQQPNHRRLICDLIFEIGHPTVAQLRELFGTAEWFVDRDLLYLASCNPDPTALQLIMDGAQHDNARVRGQALGMLQGAPEGMADSMLKSALDDIDGTVRVTAVRTLAARRTPGVAEPLMRMLQTPEFLAREAPEQRTFMVAFGSLAGVSGVATLEGILNGGESAGGVGGLLDRLRSTVEGVSDEALELRCSAAVALSAVGGTLALEALQKGQVTRHKKLREVCQRGINLITRQQGGTGPVGDVGDVDGGEA